MAYKPQVGATMSTPNVIPMADIMLVLLIIFMVVTPMLHKGANVDMTRVENPTDLPNADKDDAIIVAVSRTGDTYLGQNRIPRDQITDKVRDQISGRIDKTVFLRCDARAKYGDVVAVVDEIRAAGVDNLGLLTERAEATKSKTPPPPTSN
jgi:biopolymer transport protein ExbD/biopolymer transport protein TolR